MEVKTFAFLCAAIYLVVLLAGTDAWGRRRRRRSPPPKINCAVSGWSAWGECSKSCDSGTQTRTRTVTQSPQNGGSPCPALTQSTSCNTHPCPCKVTSWSEWSQCSTSCDPGEEHRSRVIVDEPSAGADPCPELRENRTCQISFCPCEVSGWSSWGDCNQPCDGGNQTRTREIIRHPLPGGPPCPELEESQQCNTEICSCQVSDWGGWSACSPLCGPGEQLRSRVIERPASPGGQACPDLNETRYCNDGVCVHCEVSEWSQWGECSVPCDGGEYNRSRSITQHPGPGGNQCPSLFEVDDCNDFHCPCEVSQWGSWSNCSAECGGGTQERRRHVLKQPSPGGAECPDLEEKKTCKLKECPINCEVSDWSDWWKCKYKGTYYCGSEGTQARERKILQEPEYGGNQCPALLREQRNCTSPPCPNCQASEWGPWSHCKAKCGIDGKKYRKRVILTDDDVAECPNLKESLYCTGECTTQSP